MKRWWWSARSAELRPDSPNSQKTRRLIGAMRIQNSTRIATTREQLQWLIWRNWKIVPKPFPDENWRNRPQMPLAQKILDHWNPIYRPVENVWRSAIRLWRFKMWREPRWDAVSDIHKAVGTI